MEISKCVFCGKLVGSECYCAGCGYYVCSDCSNEDVPIGRHFLEDHIEAISSIEWRAWDVKIRRDRRL